MTYRTETTIENEAALHEFVPATSSDEPPHCICGDWYDSGPSSARVRANFHQHLTLAILAALKAARIAVVELPTWESLEDDYAVDLRANQVRQYDPNGFGAYRAFDFGEIPSLCAALLAAKAAAEASQ